MVLAAAVVAVVAVLQRDSKSCPLSLHKHLGGVFKILSVFKLGVLGGSGQVLTFIKNISLVLRL